MRAGMCVGLILFSFTAGCLSQHGMGGDVSDEWRRLAGKNGWKDYVRNPIIEPGKPGEWDSWAVMSMTVVRVGDTFHLYYEGGLTGCGAFRLDMRPPPMGCTG